MSIVRIKNEQAITEIVLIQLCAKAYGCIVYALNETFIANTVDFDVVIFSSS